MGALGAKKIVQALLMEGISIALGTFISMVVLGTKEFVGTMLRMVI
jgi:hypothetical protein